jgi:hypothetical protein
MSDEWGMESEERLWAMSVWCRFMSDVWGMGSEERLWEMSVWCRFMSDVGYGK